MDNIEWIWVGSRNCGCLGTWICYQLIAIPGNKTTAAPSWWRHQMETFFALLALCAGNSPVNSPHKDQWRGALLFCFICAWINGWVNNSDAGDLRRHRAHYDVIVMMTSPICCFDRLDMRLHRTIIRHSWSVQGEERDYKYIIDYEILFNEYVSITGMIISWPYKIHTNCG